MKTLLVVATTQLCFGCLKEMLQAGIKMVYYIHSWSPSQDEEQRKQYKNLMDAFERGVHQRLVDDIRADWAKAASARPIAADPHGMQTP
jgi:deoxycytidylate deaminase